MTVVMYLYPAVDVRMRAYDELNLFYGVERTLVRFLQSRFLRTFALLLWRLARFLQKRSGWMPHNRYGVSSSWMSQSRILP